MSFVMSFLHRLSGFFFYVLGVTYFLAYILLHNRVWPVEAALWMQVADLPFAFAAIFYAGLSFYLSVRGETSSGKVLGWVVAVPLAVLFFFLVALNFSQVWPFVS